MKKRSFLRNGDRGFVAAEQKNEWLTWLSAVLLSLAILAPKSAQAQFHQNQDGATRMNQIAVNNAVQMGEGGQMLNNDIGSNPFSMMYMSQEMREQLWQKGYKASLGKQDDKNITVWGRAIIHEDGSSTKTETKDGLQLIKGQSIRNDVVVQKTFTKGGVLILRRDIYLNQVGMPKEVMMYDADGNFKYRGEFLYDTVGRFREELIFDTKGTLIRRKVQEYDVNGGRMPPRMWDYAENIPEDLRLVVTKETEEDSRERAANAQKNNTQRIRKPLFNKNKNRAEEARPANLASPVSVGSSQQNASAPAPVDAPKPKLGRALDKLFGKRK